MQNLIVNRYKTAATPEDEPGYSVICLQPAGVLFSSL
jgi:hypothetical protein